MRPSPYVRCAVCSFLVPDWNVANLKVQLACAKQKIEISKGIEIAERRPIGGNAQVVAPEQSFRSAQRILDGLAEHPCEGDAEELIRTHVEKAHRLGVHRI